MTSWVSRRASALATAAPNVRQQVIATPLVVFVGRGPAAALLDQPLFLHPLNGPVQRAGAEPDLAVGPGSDVLDDGVAVPLAIRESEQDVECRRLAEGEGQSTSAGSMCTR